MERLLNREFIHGTVTNQRVANSWSLTARDRSPLDTQLFLYFADTCCAANAVIRAEQLPRITLQNLQPAGACVAVALIMLTAVSRAYSHCSTCHDHHDGDGSSH